MTDCDDDFGLTITVYAIVTVNQGAVTGDLECLESRSNVLIMDKVRATFVWSLLSLYQESQMCIQSVPSLICDLTLSN